MVAETAALPLEGADFGVGVLARIGPIVLLGASLGILEGTEDNLWALAKSSMRGGSQSADWVGFSVEKPAYNET